MICHLLQYDTEPQSTIIDMSFQQSELIVMRERCTPRSVTGIACEEHTNLQTGSSVSWSSVTAGMNQGKKASP